MAEDDPDDRMLIAEAWEESGLRHPLHIVEHGEAVMDYLYRRGPYAALREMPLPGLILLDLNMPRKDGWEVLKEMKADPRLRPIPVVVLTTSKEEEDIYRSYDLGVNSFIVKPVTFNALVQMIRGLGAYWFEMAKIPVVWCGE
ncbi:MAG: response regulator [Nitrospinota bacterium]|nr:MAG: response regulator [Nitrospinota bacterium]